MLFDFIVSFHFFDFVIIKTFAVFSYYTFNYTYTLLIVVWNSDALWNAIARSGSYLSFELFKKKNFVGKKKLENITSTNRNEWIFLFAHTFFYSFFNTVGILKTK